MSEEIDSIYGVVEQGIREGRIKHNNLRRLEGRLNREAHFVFYESDATYMAKVAAADIDWQNLWNKYITPSHDSVGVLTGGERRDRFTVDDLEADVEDFNRKYKPLEDGDEHIIPDETSIITDKFSVAVRNQETDRIERVILKRRGDD